MYGQKTVSKERDSSERYLPHPQDTLKGKAQTVYRNLAYFTWKRELNRLNESRHYPSTAAVVDVGCGPGFLLGCLESWFPSLETIGIDASEQLLQVARTRCPRARLLKGDAANLCLESESADILFALHIVEHLSRPDSFFLEAMRVLRPGGVLIFATPNLDGLGARIMKKHWRGYSDPTHVQLHGPAFWRGLAIRSGFKVMREGTTGLSGIPPFDKMPFGLIHWIPIFLFGSFPWTLGEAYICRARKPR